MKRFIWIFLAVIAIVIVAVAVFIATFNIDQYRPLLVQKISESIDRKVTLEKLSLTWQGGVALNAKKFAIYPGEAVEEKPLARFDEAAVSVRLTPLLKKSIQIASVTLVRPQIKVVHEADGTYVVGGVSTAKKAGEKAKPSKPGAESFLITVDSVKIKKGEIYYHDKTGKKPLDLNVLDLDADIKNISLTKPLDFDFQMALFGPRRNVALAGKFQVPQGGKPGALEKVTIKTDLSQLDWTEVIKAFPDLEKAGIRGRLAGIFEANIDRYSLEPDGVETAVADIRLKDGEISIKQFQSSFSRVNLDGRLAQNNVSLRDFSAGFAGGDLRISGTIDQPTTKALSEVKASLRDLSIGELMPAGTEAAGKLNGRLSMEFQGKARGGQWPEISQTLSGRGQLSLRDGVIMNQNTLREVIDKISMIPTVGEKLRTNFPPAYLAKLNEPNTVLKPVDLPFTINNGMIYFQNLYLATDTFSITGGGEVGLDKTIHANTTLRMDPQLSAGLIASAPQMQMLAGGQGQIEVPLRIDGVLPGVSVMPDINYIGQKIAMAKGQELLTGLLTKGAKGGGQETAGAAGSTQKQTTEQSIANLFGKMLQKEEK